jgi:hypothetical protein
MRFFKLTHPDYGFDGEFTRRNPITVTSRHRVPGILCDSCGPWSSSERLRVSVPADLESEFTGSKFLSPTEWLARRDQWANRLGVSPARVGPGAEVGSPRGSLEAPVSEDFVHPFPGEAWVTKKVAELLDGANLQGLNLVEAELYNSQGVRAAAKLWAIVPTGQAWRVGSDVETLRVCDLCGRQGFPRPKVLAVDTERWDGTDFFNLDHNPNIVIVTERVRDLVRDSGFTNVAFTEAR